MCFIKKKKKNKDINLFRKDLSLKGKNLKINYLFIKNIYIKKVIGFIMCFI